MEMLTSKRSYFMDREVGRSQEIRVVCDFNKCIHSGRDCLNEKQHTELKLICL